MDLEGKRKTLESLDRIEEALTDRIRKSDQYLPTSINPNRNHFGSRNYSARENATRRWETAKLVDHYNQLKSDWQGVPPIEPNLKFEDELAKANELDDELPVVSISNKYRLHGHIRGRQRFLCEFTNSVAREIDSSYPIQENYGQFLDLEPFYHKLLEDAATEVKLGYRDYLANLTEYADHGGQDLLNYLAEYYDRANSVGKSTGTDAKDMILKAEKTGEYRSQDNKNGNYCNYCMREFANENVFKAHLGGKKHKRAAASITNEVTDPTVPIKEVLLKLVEPALKATIANIDRKSGMSLQDRKLEVEALERERELENGWCSDEDNLIENPASTDPTALHVMNRPLKGPEGNPIPRWLFRLQGLGTVFRCEICGPSVKYAGRKAFERHFNDPSHINGLKKLDIEPSAVFNGISSVAEATDLKKKLTAPTPRSTIEKEVEDEEGNALSERMYEDLKKQGLL